MRHTECGQISWISAPCTPKDRCRSPAEIHEICPHSVLRSSKATRRMMRRVTSRRGRERYRKRKHIVEAPFG